MKSPLLGVAVAIVRAWTRVYTWRVPPSLRESRRAEIESDLWESAQDAGQGPSPAMQVVVRLVLGIPDDIQWRMTHGTIINNVVMIIVALWTTAFLIGGLWVVDLLKARRLPVPPSPTWPALAPDAPRPAVHMQTSPLGRTSE
jgi:hypothetical protein